MLYVHGSVSIDARVELSIVSPSQMSIDEEELVSIDVVCFSLQIVCSKRDGSEKKRNSSLLLLVLMRMYQKNKKQILSFKIVNKT